VTKLKLEKREFFLSVFIVLGNLFINLVLSKLFTSSMMHSWLFIFKFKIKRYFLNLKKKKQIF